jgi:SAM-dependent methyltransferase
VPRKGLSLLTAANTRGNPVLAKFQSLLASVGLSRITRILPRPLRRDHARCYRWCRKQLAGKRGLELGGPSPIFRRRGALPVYARVGRLDNCNFSGHTIWEGAIAAGQTYRYHKRRPPGRQYIAEATDLQAIPAGSYDFVLSSHTLEHSANPLRVLAECRRVLGPSGVLVLILPHKDRTFDHRRPVTALDHLIDDYRRGTTEADLTHLPEILALHDLAMDPPAGNPEAFRLRSERNLENRCLHQHVFSSSTVAEMLDYMGWQMHALEPRLPFDIIALASICRPGESPRNAAFLGLQAGWRQTSPFPSDHLAGSRQAA